MYKPKSSNGISNNFSSGYEEKMDTHEELCCVDKLYFLAIPQPGVYMVHLLAISYHDKGAPNLEKVLCIHLFNPTINI